MSPVQVKINIFICQPTPPTTHALNNIMLYCHQASNSSTSDISCVAISVPAAWVHHADSLTATLQLRSINMKMSPHVSFISPKVCTAIKPQFNFIYNALSPLSSVVSPICSRTSKDNLKSTCCCRKSTDSCWSRIVNDYLAPLSPIFI